MESTELLAKATIAAALITSQAIDVTQAPRPGKPDSLRKDLRDLIEYVYSAIVDPS
jgi:hypothetical protein